MGLHIIKNLLQNKTEDITQTVGENICQLYIRQRTDSQNMQEAEKTKLSQNQ
jgi:hypothetical protein